VAATAARRPPLVQTARVQTGAGLRPPSFLEAAGRCSGTVPPSSTGTVTVTLECSQPGPAADGWRPNHLACY